MYTLADIMRFALYLLLAACVSKASDTEPPLLPEGPPSLQVKRVAVSTDAAMIERGRALFSSDLCITCHNVTSEPKVGPGLAGVTRRRTTPWIQKMLRYPEEMERLDPMAQRLKTLHTVARPDHDLQYDWEEEALLAYLQTL